MSEEVDAVGRAFGEREFPRKKSNARNAIPKSHEVDSDICAESLLELGTHFPAIRTIVLEKSVSCQYLHQTIGNKAKSREKKIKSKPRGLGVSFCTPNILFFGPKSL